MLRVLVRRTNDVHYFTDDDAREIEGLRDGGPGWWLRGEGNSRDAGDVGRVLQTTERSLVYGYDLIFAAPRPVSVLLAIDTEHANAVIAAHRKSVRAAIDYLEDRALVVRNRRDGADRDQSGRWARVVGFTHGVNRHGEPHLHDHVLVGARPLGASTVLDSRALFAHVPAADALYRTSLRYEVAERTPWSVWRSFEGVEHVHGLDEGYRALWSGHHQQRGEKLSWSRRDAVRQWSQDLERFAPERTLEPPGGDRRSLDEHSFMGSFEGRDGVARRHVVAGWSNAARFGQEPQRLLDSVDTLYPALLGAIGVREPTLGVRHVRMTSLVADLGPRPLGVPELVRWRQRSREFERSRSERSR